MGSDDHAGSDRFRVELRDPEAREGPEGPPPPTLAPATPCSAAGATLESRVSGIGASLSSTSLILADPQWKTHYALPETYLGKINHNYGGTLEEGPVTVVGLWS